MRGEFSCTSGKTGTTGLIHCQEGIREDIYTNEGSLIGWWWVEVEISFWLPLFSQKNEKQGYQLRVKSKKGVLGVKERVCIG